MAHCIYCRTDKDDSEFTLEHVIPQFLGGAHSPDFLKTRDVCKNCNSNLGLFVDASFEKNWVVSNWLRETSSALYNSDKPVGVSLICMGNSDLSPPELPDDHVCELWLGPLGEQVFWLRPHDERMSAYVGGNPRTMKSVETRAYFLFSENSHTDPLKTWLSFEQAFQGRKVKKIMCTEIDGADPADIGFTQADEIDRSRIKFFHDNSHGTSERSVQVVVNSRFDQRFLCKLAIGVAYCLFGSKVLDTDYGKELHKGLWYRGDNEEPNVRGTALFSHPKDRDINSIVGFPNAVAIALISTPDGIAINLNISSQLNWTILCAPIDTLTHQDLAKIGDGQIIVLARPLQTGIHLELPAYLAHSLGATPHPQLNAIQERAEKNKSAISPP
ncbi:HNH endonuclease [Pseudomonas frederiksbergensis]|uniref:HNH endonuclease n=1 Tax=Pseudomonas frederiksbergensis TaxID=104087 RepID=A0A1J0EEA6_9PSED|nr:HNH endonuclease [Pseudomonas frederiksbergensis]APC14434.1 HNH endonuclease [Pseudomonas frederiksbergensis]